MVEAVGLEPTMPGAADLQSAGVTNFPTPPKSSSQLAKAFFVLGAATGRPFPHTFFTVPGDCLAAKVGFEPTDPVKGRLISSQLQ